MKDKKNTPSIITKLKNFTVSLFNHVRTGMKKCSCKEISKRYATCQGCDFFSLHINDDGEVNALCNVCGCALSEEPIFMNKLAWKDQKCPKGKW